MTKFELWWTSMFFPQHLWWDPFIILLHLLSVTWQYRDRVLINSISLKYKWKKWGQILGYLIIYYFLEPSFIIILCTWFNIFHWWAEDKIAPKQVQMMTAQFHSVNSMRNEFIICTFTSMYTSVFSLHAMKNLHQLTVLLPGMRPVILEQLRRK